MWNGGDDEVVAPVERVRSEIDAIFVTRVGRIGTGIVDRDLVAEAFEPPDEIDDLDSMRLARDVSKKIEESMEYPGQIKVTVVRETRASEYAR